MPEIIMSLEASVAPGAGRWMACSDMLKGHAAQLVEQESAKFSHPLSLTWTGLLDIGRELLWRQLHAWTVVSDSA